MNEKGWKGTSDGIMGVAEAPGHKAKWCENPNLLKMLREKWSWQKKSKNLKGRNELGFLGEHQRRLVWLQQPKVSER